MEKIFNIANWEELVCPKHHIRLTYKRENGELVLKCDWCDYTLVPLIRGNDMRSYKKREVFPMKKVKIDFTKERNASVDTKIKPLRRPWWKRLFDKILKR